ncbi:hypothetical protein C922_01702 [Plasmodium inui San Antonio 1]|uniref:Uncharacterized protein n=1 Tax=Plasmodium inui San Antonio 1 TaxID=1237626 RepID=W7A8U6_9APIC|nr:hypothetical protein C922_01702 [Plasmodium inui San Antonio 1]EUD68090.1 hypothetical protein C922_01702 [Plasmodium inui San Antonio 1]
MTPSDESQHSDVTAGTVRGYKIRRGGSRGRENSLRRTANRREDPLFSYPKDYQLEHPILLNGEEPDSCPDGTLARMKKNANDDGSSYDSLVEDFFENAIKNAKKVRKKQKQERGSGPSEPSERSGQSAEGEQVEAEAEEVPEDNAFQRQNEQNQVEENKKDPSKMTIKKKLIQWTSQMLRRNLNKPRMPLMRRKKNSMHILTKKKKKNDAKGKNAKMASQAKHTNEWNSYQNDLDKYKLTKEEMEQKRNSLKSKNLDKVKVEYHQKLQRMRTGKNNARPARKSAPATGGTTRSTTVTISAIAATAATTATSTAPPNGVNIKSNEEPTLNECDPRREGTHRCASHQRSSRKDHSKLRQTSTDKMDKRRKEQRGGHSLSDVNNNHLGSPYSDTPPSYMHTSERKYPSLDLIQNDGFSSGRQYSQWDNHNRRVTQQKDRHLPNRRYHHGETKQRNKHTHLDKWSALNDPYRSAQFGDNQTFRGDYLGSSSEYSSLSSVLPSESDFGLVSSHETRRKGNSGQQKGRDKWRDKWMDRRYGNHAGKPPSRANTKRSSNHFYSRNNRSDSDRMTISTDRSASTGESTMEYFAEELKKRNEVFSPIMETIDIRVYPLEDLPPVGRKELKEKKYYPELGIKFFSEEGCSPSHSERSHSESSHPSSPLSSGVSSASTNQIDHLWDSDYTDQIQKLRCSPQMDQDILRLKRAKLETFNCIKKMVESVRTFICEGDLDEAPSRRGGAASTRVEAQSPRGGTPPGGAHRTMEEMGENSLIERKGNNPMMELLFRENEQVYADAQPSRRQQAGYTNDEAEEHYEQSKSIQSEYNNYMYLDQLEQRDDTSISAPLSDHKMEVILHQDHLRGDLQGEEYPDKDVQLETNISGHPDHSNNVLNSNYADNFSTVSSNLCGSLSRLDLTGSDLQNEGNAAASIPQRISPRGWKGHQVGRGHRGASVGKATTETGRQKDIGRPTDTGRDTANMATANMATVNMTTANMATADLGGAKLRRPEPAIRAAKEGSLTNQRRDAKQSQRVTNKKESNPSVESISSTSKGSRQGTFKTKVHSGVDTRNTGQAALNSTRIEKKTFNETRTLLRGKGKGEAKDGKLTDVRGVGGTTDAGTDAANATKDVTASTRAHPRDQRLISQKILNTSINFDETQNLSDEDQFIFDTYLNEATPKREDNLEDIIRNQVALFERDFL